MWYVVYLVVPEAVRGVVYVVGGVVSLVLVGRRVGQLPQPVRNIARLMFLAGFCAISGGVIRGLQSAITGVHYPFPSIADVLVAASYVLLIAAMFVMVKRRLPPNILDPALDAAVGGIAIAVLQWVAVIIPYVQDASPTNAALFLNLAYATGCLALVVMAVFALVAGGHRSVANRILAGALFATVLIDSMTTLVLAGAIPEMVRTVIAPMGLMLGTAGLLHPSVVLIASRPSDPSQLRRLTRKRIGVLGLALATCPVLLVALLVRDPGDPIALLPAAASLALAPLVVVRLGRLVQQNEELAALEATLRSVGERLVAAETTADVGRVVTVGLEQVLQANFVNGGMVLDPQSDKVDADAGDLMPAVEALRTTIGRGDHHTTGEVHRVEVAGGHWNAGLVVVQRRVVGLLVTVTRHDLTDEERGAIQALCREASIALRAVEQTEQTVRERSEERFGALVDNSSDIVTILDDRGRLTYVSPVAVRLLGYPSDFRGIEHALDLVHPDDRELAARTLENVRYGDRSPVEVRLRAQDGSYHWFEVVGVDLQSDPNIRGIVLNAREIGDRKAAEQQLQLSEARFKALVQNSSDVVLVVGSADGVRYASPSVEHTIGLSPEQLVGHTLEETFRDSGVDWDSALRSGRREEEHPELLEFGFRNSRGEWIHLEASVTDLRREEAVGGFVLNARDVTERTTMMQRLRYQSTHDALTGLANRVLAAEELGGMLGRNAGGSTVAVISLDIDDFKDVNDSLGHGVGDRLLYAVADRIKESLAFGDVAARGGGDEFIVVLERAHGEAQVLELADRLLSSIERPFTIDGRELSITASAGVAYDHDRETAAEVLLRNADTAMYRAKQLGKRRSVVFESHMHTASFDRLELRADLARALETDQFMAHYQPIIDLDTHQIVGCEALIRWQHPHRGLLSPAIFVPLAEESGLIGPMGEWMLERACRDLSEWRTTMPELAEALTISVNLTAQEVHGERLVPVVTDILRRTSLPADRLVLEVTESNLLSDTDVIQERMQRLRALGTRLAIDDFGTGYSSLGYIQRFAFDVLKIDRSFVEGLDRQTNRQIVTAVLDLARELGVRVVAEGIEEEEQERALVELGCKFAQGYRYSRPVPAADFRKLLLQQAVPATS
ncbi:putative bifunctional diguanylate cyclase/phosphodiesterase [Dermatobacter hominis]|uniref:putative bifunctional diguanylate cyclase/phosphodiesterase n=1 Tax=Dermatobacter hominis TaxID=2884263 RepID=UPI001D107A30|nr:bifunctional diguanylate cyclase/phosphodiesterase [Dermatobacter hominis]UDY36214.1 EAL domain-containing protein [Dermatobacter hominis]